MRVIDPAVLRSQKGLSWQFVVLTVVVEYTFALQQVPPRMAPTSSNATTESYNAPRRPAAAASDFPKQGAAGGRQMKVNGRICLRPRAKGTAVLLSALPGSRQPNVSFEKSKKYEEGGKFESGGRDHDEVHSSDTNGTDKNKQPPPLVTNQ